MPICCAGWQSSTALRHWVRPGSTLSISTFLPYRRWPPERSSTSEIISPALSVRNYELASASTVRHVASLSYAAATRVSTSLQLWATGVSTVCAARWAETVRKPWWNSSCPQWGLLKSRRQLLGLCCSPSGGSLVSLKERCLLVRVSVSGRWGIPALSGMAVSRTQLR